MDGYEVARRLRAVLGPGRTPVIAMTAHAMSDERDLSLQAGMVAHLTKPIDARQLYAALLTWANPRYAASDSLIRSVA